MNELENLKNGLSNFSESCDNIENASLEGLMNLYGNISVLIDKSMAKYFSEIACPAQSLQFRIMEELEKRIRK